jgi:hypothetical protein
MGEVTGLFDQHRIGTEGQTDRTDLRWPLTNATQSRIFATRLRLRGNTSGMLRTLLFIFVIGCTTALAVPSACAATEPQSVSGYVVDSTNGETLIGATVTVKGTKLGAVTNKRGYFIIQNVPAGLHVLRCSYVGFRSVELPVTVGESSVAVRLIMPHEAVRAEDVTVEARREDEQHEVRISTVNVSAEKVQQLPAFGETDLFRALQYLPGVLTSSVISSGLYIRGGSPDQNLVLLDGSTVYNPSHLFGFFSTFNSDAIKDVELIKGGFPAEYGGRLSAVINVTNRDGDRNAPHAKASVGLISSRLNAEVPFWNGAAILSARRTYVDIVTGVLPKDPQNPLPSYYFYDLNGKVMQDVGTNDKVYASGYLGADHITQSGGGIDFALGWGNWAGAGRWTHLFGANLVSDLNVTASHYYNTLDGNNGGFKFNINNTITDYTAKLNFDWYASEDHMVKFGAQGTQYIFQYVQNFTGTDSAANDQTGATNITVKDLAYAVYAQDAWQLTSLLSLQAGLRLEWTLLNQTLLIDPRVSLRYTFQDGLALKASWGIYHQYLHLAAQDNFSFFDVWLPSDNTVGPSTAYQYILGLETHPWEGYALSFDSYYKSLADITSFRSYAVKAEKESDVFSVGSGRSYGLEVFFEKQTGAFTGWFGYSLAWVTQKFPDLNGGLPFPPKYDRRHDINLVGTWQIDLHWRVGAAWVYGTGQTYTAATSRFRTHLPGQTEGVDYTVPGERNALRLPASHRMDANVAYSTHFWQFPAVISLDIFNLYSHRDVWFRYYNTRKNPTEITDVRLLPIIPTASVEVTF